MFPFFTRKALKAKYFALPLDIVTDRGVLSMAQARKGTYILGRDEKRGEIIQKITSIEKITQHGDFYCINGEVLLYSEQSVMIGQNAIHVRLLKVGDELTGSGGAKITIHSIEKMTGRYYFYRLEVSGNHTYYLNGLLMHNASRFWVGGTGTWDNSDTTHWSGSSGGAGGSSVPGSGDTVTFNGSSGGGTITPNYNFNVTSITMGAFTGTFECSTNNPSPTLSTFSNSGSGARTFNMGSGTWTISAASGTVWTQLTVTNLTFNGGSSTVKLTSAAGSGRTVQGPSIATVTMNNLWVAGSSDSVTISQMRLTGNIDFTGFTGTWVNSATNMSGSLTLGSGMTATAGANNLTFENGAAMGVTYNSVQMERPFIMNGTGTFKLTEDTNLVPSTTNRNFTLTAGGLDLQSFKLRCGQFVSNVANTRTMTLGSGTIELTNSSNAFNIASGSLSLDAGTSTIKFVAVDASLATFIGAGLTWYNLWFARGTDTGTCAITGANTFNDIKDDGTAAHAITFPNSTTTVKTLTLDKGSGANITLQRTGGSGNWTLSKASGIVSLDYVTISNGLTAGGALYYAGPNSTDGGGNVGWIFTNPNPGGFAAFFLNQRTRQ